MKQKLSILFILLISMASCNHTDHFLSYSVDNQTNQEIYVSYVTKKSMSGTDTIAAGKTTTLRIQGHENGCPSTTFSAFSIVSADSSIVYAPSEIVDSDWTSTDYREQVDCYYTRYSTIYTYIIKP